MVRLGANTTSELIAARYLPLWAAFIWSPGWADLEASEGSILPPAH